MGDAGSPKKGYSSSHPQIANTKNIPPKPTLFLLFVSLALFCFYFYFYFYFYTFPPSPFRAISNSDDLFAPRPEQQFITPNETSCDLFNGKWVQDSSGPLYNGTRCSTIKEGQNCMAHGRPDMGFLHWRWEPSQCGLPRFEPDKFLRLLANKHLAFAGDSLARNQLESLLCMLATVSAPDLVYKQGEENQFRRWYVASHNLTISLYWSPFLVKTVEKSNSDPNNRVYMDFVDERWASELDSFDIIVLTFGNWFLIPSVYYKGDHDHVLGCHVCVGLNYTEIGFYDVFRMALKTTIETIKERRGNNNKSSSSSSNNINRSINVLVTTFPPSHFEGEWDKFGACAKTRPFEEGERELNWNEKTMREIVMEEVEATRLEISKLGLENNIQVEAFDVTRLSSMRPDGHPGPYMHPFPFANGVIGDRVQNDCVHWCLPGPIDTWNEILLELVKRWWRDWRRETIL